MYGFRKPFTVATYEGSEFNGIGFKTMIVSIQVIGYMISKFIGIKVISEMPANRRAVALLGLIGVAELGLAVFGILPRPYNAVGLFVNGLALGMVFGLVLGFLEGRRLTEALVAGLCASFILADGVTKSVGKWVLDQGVPEDWMPFVSGLIFLVPLVISVAVLAKVPPPDEDDIAARSARHEMTSQERWALFQKYGLGLSMVVAIFLLVTIIRSVRADFAVELWNGLGTKPDAQIFTRSEMIVALGITLVNGLAVLIRNNRLAFFVSLGICGLGLLVITMTLFTQQQGAMDPFTFMVLIGFGLYLPYVAVHTTVFERLLAMTRERGNLGYLMYVADAIGYLGYVGVMFAKDLVSTTDSFLQFFLMFCWFTVGVSVVCLGIAWRYFQVLETRSAVTPAVEGAT
ncbi:hypothetical protein DTL42_01795 [Bremerella cremea]|uniref:MFS transporter n=2 Tax=Bremerella cremea TaxID=1031537 RepID=A0A368KZF3_9BACT|nr:hypothetical protein DTL42_01795 [Bremerella cremea]